MKKLIHTHISTAAGLALVAVVSFVMGGLFLKEARSFMDPVSVPGGAGSLAPDGGVIGNPAQGIAGADTLFKGQKAIKDAVGGSFAGYTSTATNGNLGGLKGANQKCETAYPGSHWASLDEIMKLGAQYPWTYDVWVRDALASYGDSTVGGQDVAVVKDGLTMIYPDPDFVVACAGWTAPVSKAGTALMSSGIAQIAGCSFGARLACVK